MKGSRGGSRSSQLGGSTLSEEAGSCHSSKELAVLEAGAYVLSPAMNCSCSELYTRPQLNSFNSTA